MLQKLLADRNGLHWSPADFASFSHKETQSGTIWSPQDWWCCQWGRYTQLERSFNLQVVHWRQRKIVSEILEVAQMVPEIFCTEKPFHCFSVCFCQCYKMSFLLMVAKYKVLKQLGFGCKDSQLYLPRSWFHKDPTLPASSQVPMCHVSITSKDANTNDLMKWHDVESKYRIDITYILYIYIHIYFIYMKIHLPFKWIDFTIGLTPEPIDQIADHVLN